MEDTVKIAMAETKTVRAPIRSATHPLIGMNTASISKYAVIPMFRSTGFVWKDLPMSGNAVAITVPSRFSMKKAVEPESRWSWIFGGMAAWSGVLYAILRGDRTAPNAVPRPLLCDLAGTKLFCICNIG